jgi:hypothetical protein
MAGSNGVTAPISFSPDFGYQFQWTTNPFCDAGKLFCRALQSFFDPLARFLRELGHRSRLLLMPALARGGANQGDLPAVPAAPFAQEQMNPQSQPLGQGKPPVERVGLEPGRLFAGGKQGADPKREAF